MSIQFCLKNRVRHVRPQPSTESDDGRVAACSMLWAPFVASSSSLPSSVSSGSESIMLSHPPIPNLLIFTWLQDILEIPMVEAAHQTVEPIKMEPHTNTSASMFLYVLRLLCCLFRRV
jgi:hypothetical protein